MATNGLAIVVTALALIGIGYAALQATSFVQAAVAVGLAWYLLIGGLVDDIRIPRGSDRSDLAALSRETWVLPKIFWHAAFTAVGLACLWVGGRALLGYS